MQADPEHSQNNKLLNPSLQTDLISGPDHLNYILQQVRPSGWPISFVKGIVISDQKAHPADLDNL